EINRFTGLLQEDFNASRVLAFYFLKPHDSAMASFCKSVPAEYYRFVDDMTVLVNSEVEGRMALKAMTESLRRLNLVASLEKTAIMPKKLAIKELFLEENKKIDKLHNELIDRLKNNKSLSPTVKKINRLYEQLLSNEKHKFKNWQKILKRFYTLNAIGQTNVFGKDVKTHLVIFPQISADIRLRKFLLRQTNLELNKLITTYVKYLYSAENLYQQLETNLLESFLAIPKSRISRSNILILKNLGRDILFRPTKYSSQSAYAKCLATLLCYKFDHCNDEIAKGFLSSKFEDPLLRKYYIAVSLTNLKLSVKENILKKARKDPSPTIQRFIHMIDNSSRAQKEKSVQEYINLQDLYIYAEEKSTFKIIEKYENVRGDLLKQILNSI
ncbi:MAG TPA: hypothetical protein PLS50_06400, partial [Candidatus Dojkabacteria bacterium]|nr:hypothetical protein [Candidatus Dojkabacteria bacterium]